GDGEGDPESHRGFPVVLGHRASTWSGNGARGLPVILSCDSAVLPDPRNLLKVEAHLLHRDAIAVATARYKAQHTAGVHALLRAIATAALLHLETLMGNFD